jgi:hypothetical protein
MREVKELSSLRGVERSPQREAPKTSKTSFAFLMPIGINAVGVVTQAELAL